MYILMDISYIKHVFAYFGWNNDFLNSKNVTAICIEESADEETKEQFKDIPNEAASIFGASDHIPCVLQLLMDYVGMDPNGIIDNNMLSTRPPVHKAASNGKSPGTLVYYLHYTTHNVP